MAAFQRTKDILLYEYIDTGYARTFIRSLNALSLCTVYRALVVFYTASYAGRVDHRPIDTGRFGAAENASTNLQRWKT